MECKLTSLLIRNAGRTLTHQYITKQIRGRGRERSIASPRVVTATLRKSWKPPRTARGTFRRTSAWATA